MLNVTTSLFCPSGFRGGLHRDTVSPDKAHVPLQVTMTLCVFELLETVADSGFNEILEFGVASCVT